MQPMGDLSFEDCVAAYKKVIEAGKDGADLVAPRVLTKEEAAAFIEKLNEEF